ncbi:MAG TPA: hypothetical protein VGN01_06570 [Acidobacteriaceae bacterium]|jgi:hypothetical protein
MISSLPLYGTTWYVRRDGGTRYSANSTNGRCDGKADSAAPRTGTNQHCAFNDIRFLWTDGSYTTDSSVGAPKWGWIGAGGDTYIIRDGPWRIGQNGPNPGDGFGLAGNPFGAGAPPPPSGTPDAHTKIFGANHGSCAAQSARTQIFGGYGVGTVLSLNGASYVDVACLDISDHSNCGRQGQASACKTDYPVGDFSTDGLGWSNTSTNDTVTDMRIHGMARAGMIGPTGTGVVITDIELVANASSGWNADNGSGTTGTGTLLVQDFTISWNGCAEEYPIVDKLPYQDCTDDSGGGYGDGFGTATTASKPGWKARFDRGVVSYNTQDGLDALHLTGAGSSMTINRVLAFGNMGQQIKVGGQQGISTNNLVVTNCNALRQSIPGTPAKYNSHLSDFCRAADTGIALTIGKGTTLTFDNNTIYSASTVGIEISCDGTAGPCDATSLIDYRNNIFLSFMNDAAAGYPGGGNGKYSSVIYVDKDITSNPFTNSGSAYSNNILYYPTSKTRCLANVDAQQACRDPHLVDETWHVYGYGNMSPASGSAAAAGPGVSGFDLAQGPGGVSRPKPPTPRRLGLISGAIFVAALGLGIWQITSSRTKKA